MKRTPNWTPEQLDELKKYAGALPCSQIGKMLGRSKDAVKNKITSLDLPRFVVTFEVRQKAPTKSKTTPSPREPLVALYKNHTKRFVTQEDASTRIEWCPQCFSPVSNWQEHFERLGHKRA